MIVYLIICSLMIPVNLWAAITPHLHSDLSMRVLHGVSTLILIPLLIRLWQQRQLNQTMPSLILGIFLILMITVNVKITVIGMGVAFGWLDHLLLTLASVSVVSYFLLEPSATSSNTRRAKRSSQQRQGC